MGEPKAGTCLDPEMNGNTFCKTHRRWAWECRVAALQAEVEELREAVQKYLDALAPIDRETVEAGELEAALAREGGKPQ